MRKALFVLSALIMAAIVSGEAFAHHGRARVGVYVGPYWGPYWGWGPGYYYPPPYYYYPPAPAQPTEYIERIDSSEQGWWYFCDESRGYYPHVKDCPAGWKRVAPVPPAPATSSTPAPVRAYQPPAPAPPAAPTPPAAPVPPAAPTPPAGPS
jgi:hypothetical protein